MTWQFNDPVRVMAFNTLEHWADDVSKDVAQEVQARCDIAGESVPQHLRDFVDTYAAPTRQWATGLGGEECMAFQRKVAIGAQGAVSRLHRTGPCDIYRKSGERWVHEIKFDGYRVQVHVAHEVVKIFTLAELGVSARLLTTPGTSLPVRRSLTARSLSRPRAAPPTSPSCRTS